MSKRPAGAKKVAAFLVLAFIVYGLVAVVLTWPLAIRGGTHYFSPETPGDGVGIISESWYAGYAREHGLNSQKPTLYAYPWGYDHRGIPVYPLANGVLNQLSRLFGPQGAYSFMLLMSYPLAGAAMFLLVYYLTRSFPASFLAGFLYAFSPWHVSRTFDQLSLTGVHTLPLFLLLVLVFYRRRDSWSALGLTAAWIVAFYTDVHFGLFCTALGIVFLLAAWLVGLRRRRTAASSRNGDLRRTAILLVAVVLVVALAVAPFLKWPFGHRSKVLASQRQGTTEEAALFSANPWNYIVPPAHALAWRWFTDDFVKSRLGLRTSNEVTGYPGVVTFVMAVIALFMLGRRAFSRCDLRSEVASPWTADGRSSEILLYFCCLAALCAFVLSLPPTYRVAGHEIPMPSYLVLKVVPFFRYFCRWAVVVVFVLCLLAGIAVAMLARRRSWRRPATWSLVMVLLALFCLDVTIVPPLRARLVRVAPEVLESLAEYPDSEPVAIYPLAQGGEYANLHYRYFQQFHEHPMLNGVPPGTEEDLYRQALKDIYSPYTPQMLAALGIEKVVVLDRYYRSRDYGNYPYGVPFEPSRMPPGYELVEETTDGWIYEVTAAPAQVFPLYYSGLTPPGLQADGRSWTAMIAPSAEMKLVNDGGAGTFQMDLTVANPGSSGRLRIEVDGKLVTGVEVDNGSWRLQLPQFRLESGTNSLTLEWSGEAVTLDGTQFRREGELDVYLMLTEPLIRSSP